jgi:anthranilate phosphoribosyltransferase
LFHDPATARVNPVLTESWGAVQDREGPTSSMILRDLMRLLGSAKRDGRNLTHDEAYRAFELICSGGQSEIQVGAFLIALRWKGVTVDELTAFARAARSLATIPCRHVEDLVVVSPPHDGFDHVPPLETAAGLVAAGAGVKVLVVSDRCVPPKRGLTASSALEALGLSMTWDPAQAERWVASAGFAVISASGMLPGLMGLRRVRGEIGVRTPLATIEKLIAPPNAAMVTAAQAGPVLGVAVEVLASLGHSRGIAIQGAEGGVIPQLTRRTRGIELSGSHQVPLSIEPADFGLGGGQEPDLPMFGPPDEGYGTGDNPQLVQACGEITRSVLAGETSPARSATCLGAALMLKAVGRAHTLADGVSQAAESIDSGAARRVLQRLRELA